MKVLPLIIILLYLSPFHAKADTGNRTLSGSVTDANGEALPGVNLIWLGTTTGTTTNLSGAFELKRTDRDQQLVVSCIGFTTDTLAIAPEQEYIDIILQEGMELQEVNVVARKITLQKLRNSVMNTDMISKDELFRAACCNLGESFVTNPSVDVNYSDAATGAKQIRLLGLSGTYVQLLTENIPNFRGASAAYGLGYVPGPWMQSIQVSKGTSSVKNGYEALTGQINIEFKKPQSPEADWVSANLFASTTSRYEANADASVKLSDKWSTMLLAHIMFCTPYVILSVTPKLRSLDPNLADAALDLGATPLQALTKVIVPQIMPGIISGALIAFTMSSIGVAVPVQGGIGPWHFMVIATLVCFGVGKDDAAAFALVVHTIQTVWVIVCGLFGIVALPITNKKPEAKVLN